MDEKDHSGRALRNSPTHSSPALVGSERADHREWIGGAVRTLLAIYHADFLTDPLVAAEIGRMWTDDLERFDRKTIEQAIARYRRNETRKPVPATIIAICTEIAEPTIQTAFGTLKEVW